MIHSKYISQASFRYQITRKLPLSPHHQTPPPPIVHTLTSLRIDLVRRTLRSLLALDPARLALGCTSCGLGLLRLLLALRRGLLVLALLDGCRACCGAGFWALCAALLDHVEGGSDDGALGLDGTASALLGDFLYAWTSRQLCSSEPICTSECSRSPKPSSVARPVVETLPTAQ